MHDQRHVEVFVAVADELHMGRAAAHLGIPRTTLAARLRAFEAGLGMCLVDRSHRSRIALTPQGAAVLPAARALLSAEEELDTTARAVREGERGVVRVAVLTEPDARTDEVLDTLRWNHEGWTVELLSMSWAEAGRALAVGGLECVIARGLDPLHVDPGIRDRRPNRLERCSSLSIAATGAASVRVTWRGSWAADRRASWFVHDLQRMHVVSLDQKYPHRRAARLTRTRRRGAFRDEELRFRADAEDHGLEVATARRRARDAERVRSRMRETLAGGKAVGVHLQAAWLAMFGEDADLPWPDAGPTGPGPTGGPPSDRPTGDGLVPGRRTDGGPTGGAPTDGGPLGGGSADSAPTDGGPLGGAPTDSAPTDGGPLGGAPTDSAPTDGGPLGGAPTDGGSTGGAPTDGGPADGAPTDGGPKGGAPTHGGSTGGAPTGGGSTGGGPQDGGRSGRISPGSAG